MSPGLPDGYPHSLGLDTTLPPGLIRTAVSYKAENITIVRPSNKSPGFAYMNDGSEETVWGRGTVGFLFEDSTGIMVFAEKNEPKRILKVPIEAGMGFELENADVSGNQRRVLWIKSLSVEISGETRKGGTYGVRGTPDAVEGGEDHQGLQQILEDLVRALDSSEPPLSPLESNHSSDQLSPLGSDTSAAKVDPTPSEEQPIGGVPRSTLVSTPQPIALAQYQNLSHDASYFSFPPIELILGISFGVVAQEVCRALKKLMDICMVPWWFAEKSFIMNRAILFFSLLRTTI